MRLAHALTMLLATLSAAGCSQLPPLPFSSSETAEVAPASTVAERAPIAAPRRGETQQVALAQNYSLVSLPESPYKLDSGDKLRVVVFGQEGVTNSYAVDAAGNITMPLIGSVPARGLTTQQLGGSIVAKLKQGYIREPHVAVEVETYRPFFILGEVTFPGQYPYVANMTVETAVAIAGGFSPRAKRNEVGISRPYGGQVARGTVPLGTQVRPGDTITVAERWF
ncbi:MAG: polysaccharide biosynthesis/export family protein [Xanthobacteraceae bacterium]